MKPFDWYFWVHSCETLVFFRPGPAPGPLAAALALFPAWGSAQGMPPNPIADHQRDRTRSQLDPNLPNSTASKTAQELEAQNIFNPEDAASLLPSTTVRKRYLGDRNANIGGRSFGTLQPGRALVYLDGYLISNFLGRFDAPRWNMINVEAIERVDALYGPYSAIYPGNSIGTTMVVTERKPRGLEASASIKYNRQSFDEYGTHESYGSKAVVGAHCLAPRFRALDGAGCAAPGQPGPPHGLRQRGAGAPPAVPLPRPPRAPGHGHRYDRDSQGRERAILEPQAATTACRTP